MDYDAVAYPGKRGGIGAGVEYRVHLFFGGGHFGIQALVDHYYQGQRPDDAA